MAAAKDPKMNVTRPSDDKGADDKLAFFRELAKATKPIGPSSKGKKVESGEEE